MYKITIEVKENKDNTMQVLVKNQKDKTKSTKNELTTGAVVNNTIQVALKNLEKQN